MQLTVTAKGQITLKRSVLKHINVLPGDKVELDLNEKGFVTLRATKPTHTWNDVANFLDGELEGKSITLEQIDEAIAQGYVRRGSRSL